MAEIKGRWKEVPRELWPVTSGDAREPDQWMEFEPDPEAFYCSRTIADDMPPLDITDAEMAQACEMLTGLEFGQRATLVAEGLCRERQLRAALSKLYGWTTERDQLKEQLQAALSRNVQKIDK